MANKTWVSRSVFIQGRTWFDKVNGNTYNSCAVYTDGEFRFSLGMGYGYGDTWRDRALEQLVTLGYLPPRESYEAVSTYFKRLGLDFYESRQDGPKRCLHKTVVDASVLAEIERQLTN